jgi:hypothetical protein
MQFEIVTTTAPEPLPLAVVTRWGRRREAEPLVQKLLPGALHSRKLSRQWRRVVFCKPELVSFFLTFTRKSRPRGFFLSTQN